MFRPWLLLAVLLAACPEPEEEVDIPDLSGDWNFSFTLVDTECNGPDYAFADVFGFLDNADAGLPVTSAVLSQSGTSLSVLFESNDCELDGSVGDGGTVSFSGACDDAAMDRDLGVRFRAQSAGTESWTVATDTGVMEMDIDANDGAGGGPDGVVDCVVSTVQVTGSGSSL